MRLFSAAEEESGIWVDRDLTEIPFKEWLVEIEAVAGEAPVASREIGGLYLAATVVEGRMILFIWLGNVETMQSRLFSVEGC